MQLGAGTRFCCNENRIRQTLQEKHNAAAGGCGMGEEGLRGANETDKVQ